MLDVRIRHIAVAVSVWVVRVISSSEAALPLVGAALDLPLAEAV
jgi:hypothetical protein